MKIVNRTKNVVLAEDIILASRPIARIKGLLGSKELRPGQAMVLRPCNSIHTFFMRFAIDVLFVGKKNQVVKALCGLPPFRLSNIYFQASCAIELPTGTITATKTTVGDILQITQI